MENSDASPVNGNGSGNAWMIPIIGSSLCWALADLVCDVVIGEELDELSGGTATAIVSPDDDDGNDHDHDGDGSNADKRGLKEKDSVPLMVKEKGSGLIGEDILFKSNKDHDGAVKGEVDDSVTIGKRNTLKDTDGTASAISGKDGMSNNNNNSLLINGNVDQTFVIGSETTGSLVKRRLDNTGASISNSIGGVGIKDREGNDDLSISHNSSSTLHGNSSKHDNHGSSGGDDDAETHMTGNQECAVSGMVTMLVIYLMCMQRWTSHIRLRQELTAADNIGIGAAAFGSLWSPFKDYEWWVAATGGCLLFYHYLVLYWAHETAPSTVINPLLQVSSTWLLLGSAIPAMINNSTYIEPFDLMCYGIVVFGGLLPSLNGNMKAMASLKFWKRDFVRYSFLSELTIGIYDLLLSFVLKASAAKEHKKALDPNNKEPIRALDDGVLENEFFFIAWCWFAISFALSYALNSKLRQEFIGLWKLPVKIIVFSAFGQCLTLSGYYLSQFAYSLFYQVSVVHGAEASLGQAFNLITAFIAKKFFNVGRDSAVSNMKIKVISVSIVAFGLGLLAKREMLSETENRRL